MTITRNRLAGDTVHVKGVGDWEGHVTGKAWIPSYFGGYR